MHYLVSSCLISALVFVQAFTSRDAMWVRMWFPNIVVAADFTAYLVQSFLFFFLLINRFHSWFYLEIIFNHLCSVLGGRYLAGKRTVPQLLSVQLVS